MPEIRLHNEDVNLALSFPSAAYARDLTRVDDKVKTTRSLGGVEYADGTGRFCSSG